MISTEMREKISKLPVWARDYIAHLDSQADPNRDEVNRMRKENEKLNRLVRKLEASIECAEAIFTAASKQENETAKAYVERMASEYLVTEEEE